MPEHVRTNCPCAWVIGSDMIAGHHSSPFFMVKGVYSCTDMYSISHFTSISMVKPPFFPVKPPFLPVKPPFLPVKPPFFPVTPPFLLVKPPFLPVKPPFFPVTPPFLPVKPPFLPVKPPFFPVTPPFFPVKPPFFMGNPLWGSQALRSTPPLAAGSVTARHSRMLRTGEGNSKLDIQL